METEDKFPALSRKRAVYDIVPSVVESVETTSGFSSGTPLKTVSLPAAI